MSSKIECFLQELIDKEKKGELSNETLKRIGELYVNYKKEDKDTEDKDIVEDKDFMKYYTMGWFVYNTIKDVK